MAVALLISGVLLAQENDQVVKEKKSMITLQGGPGFPIGDFASTNLNNENAGFAKTGYTIMASYAYHFEKTAAITASAFYNSFGTQKFSMSFLGDGSGQTIDLDMDHWKFYGLTVGPMLTFDVGKNVYTDIKLMGGVVNANSPQISYQGTVMAKGDWSFAPALQGGVNLRIGTNSNWFVIASADYTYAKPKFSYTYTDEFDQLVTDNIHQKMSVVNVSAGVGITF